MIEKRTLNVVVFYHTVPLYSGNYIYYLMLILLKCTHFPTQEYNSVVDGSLHKSKNLNSIKKKNRLYKRYLSSPNIAMETKYKRYRNKLNHSLRLAKRLYYEQQLERNKSNCKKTWNILNEIINKRKQTSKLPSTFIINNVDCSDPISIANNFSKYFSTLGSNLASKIPQVPVPPNSFLSGEFVDSMFFDITTEQEVTEIVNSFRNGVASGYDNLPVSVIKESIDLIAKPLAHIVNLSISSGIFPDFLKIARVIPVFKSGDRRLMSNYRPVSVLPIFSKVFERVVYNRLISYVDRLNILTENQYGFRKDHSTSWIYITKFLQELI